MKRRRKNLENIERHRHVGTSFASSSNHQSHSNGDSLHLHNGSVSPVCDTTESMSSEDEDDELASTSRQTPTKVYRSGAVKFVQPLDLLSSDQCRDLLVEVNACDRIDPNLTVNDLSPAHFAALSSPSTQSSSAQKLYFAFLALYQTAVETLTLRQQLETVKYYAASCYSDSKISHRLLCELKAQESRLVYTAGLAKCETIKEEKRNGISAMTDGRRRPQITTRGISGRQRRYLEQLTAARQKVVDCFEHVPRSVAYLYHYEQNGLPVHLDTKPLASVEDMGKNLEEAEQSTRSEYLTRYSNMFGRKKTIETLIRRWGVIRLMGQSTSYHLIRSRFAFYLLERFERGCNDDSMCPIVVEELLAGRKTREKMCADYRARSRGRPSRRPKGHLVDCAKAAGLPMNLVDLLPPYKSAVRLFRRQTPKEFESESKFLWNNLTEEDKQVWFAQYNAQLSIFRRAVGKYLSTLQDEDVRDSERLEVETRLSTQSWELYTLVEPVLKYYNVSCPYWNWTEDKVIDSDSDSELEEVEVDEKEEVLVLEADLEGMKVVRCCTEEDVSKEETISLSSEEVFEFCRRIEHESRIHLSPPTNTTSDTFHLNKFLQKRATQSDKKVLELIRKLAKYAARYLPICILVPFMYQNHRANTNEVAELTGQEFELISYPFRRDLAAELFRKKYDPTFAVEKICADGSPVKSKKRKRSNENDCEDLIDNEYQTNQLDQSYEDDENVSGPDMNRLIALRSLRSMVLANIKKGRHG